MARRVNTKFVISLVVVLGVCFAGITGWIIINKLHERNPEVSKARGEAAEKAGDLKTAVANYFRAASLSSVNHLPGADELYAHAAELSMEISRKAQTQDDALRYYRSAIDGYNYALTENPHNKKVNATLLEERHQEAIFFPSIASWSTMEEIATKMIKTEDGAEPRILRAEARLKRMQLSPQGPSNAGLDEVLADLDEAQKTMPDLGGALKSKPDSPDMLKLKSQAGEAVALRGEVLWLKAKQSAVRRGLSTLQDFQADEEYTKSTAMARELLENHITTYGTHADVAFTLARMLGEQFGLSGQTDKTLLASAIKNIEDAVEVSPDDPVKSGWIERLGGVYINNGQPEKAEQLFQKFVAKRPEQPEVYNRLAQFYRDTGDLPKAIASYKDVTKHNLIGVGREAYRNERFQLFAVEGIAWLNLDLADQNASSPEAQKPFLKEAMEFTDKLRTSHAPKGIVELLDGRTQLVTRDLNQSLLTLRKAEADLSGSPELEDRYALAELLLSTVNVMQNQPGGALDFLDKVLKIYPNHREAILRKGRLLLQLGRLTETRTMFERILGPKNPNDGRFANEGQFTKNFIDQARQLYAISLADSGDLKALEGERAYLTLATAQFGSEDYESAAANAAHALEESGKNTDEQIQKAYQVGIVSNAQLKRNDIANSLVAEAQSKYPNSPLFQVLKAQLNLPPGADPIESQKLIIESITDEYLKLSAYATFYHQQKQWDDELKSLQKAETIVATAGTPDDRRKLFDVIERIFSTALTAATVSKGTPAEAGYYATAQAYVTKSEKLNLDGTGGLLMRGRLELAKTNGKTGLDFIRQAVRAQPDYAIAHMVLGQAYMTISAVNSDAASTNSGASAAVTSNRNLALEEFRQVIRLAPNNTRAMEMAVRLLLNNGDSTSSKEAQTLVESGLRIAPRNSFFMSESEILSGNLRGAIERRQTILTKNPDDLDNRTRLANLYLRLKDDAGSSEAVKKDAIEKAIAVIEWAFQKDQKNLGLANMLAGLLVENDHTEVGATRALKILGTFIESTDAAVKYNGLVSKGEFLHNLALAPGAFEALRDAKLVKEQSINDEAVATLTQAVALQPADSNEAERHLADLFFDIARWSDAQSAYSKVLSKEANPTIRERVLRRFIESELREDIPVEVEKRTNFRDAVARLDEALKKDPRDMQALILRAFAVVQQANLETNFNAQKSLLASAIEYLNRALLIDPSNPDALYYRATTNLRLGGRNVEDAIHDLLLAAKKDTMAVNCRLILADVYRRSRRYEEASVEYREIIDRHPELIKVRVDYIDFLMSAARQQRTLPPDSGEEFVLAIRRLDPENKIFDQIKTASELFPGNQAKWLLSYGQLLDMQGKYDQSRSVFQSLYEAIPNDVQLIDLYLASLNRVKEFSKAVEIATPLLKDNGTFMTEHPEWSVLYLRRAAAYQALGQQPDAIADVDQAFSFSTDAAVKSNNYVPFVAVLNQAADILSKPLIAERLRVRLAANPKETISRVGLMQVLLTMKQFTEALQVCDGTVVPTDNPTLKMLVLRETGMVRYQSKQFAAAEKDFKAVLEITPNEIDTLNNYAYMLADGMNRAPEAVKIANTALQILNTQSYESQVNALSASIYDTLGWSLYRNDDPEGAIAALQVAVHTQPLSESFYHLALAYQKAKKIVEAQQACSEGIKFATTRKDDVLPDLQKLQDTLNAK